MVSVPFKSKRVEPIISDHLAARVFGEVQKTVLSSDKIEADGLARKRSNLIDFAAYARRTTSCDGNDDLCRVYKLCAVLLTERRRGRKLKNKYYWEVGAKPRKPRKRQLSRGVLAKFGVRFARFGAPRYEAA